MTTPLTAVAADRPRGRALLAPLGWTLAAGLSAAVIALGLPPALHMAAAMAALYAGFKVMTLPRRRVAAYLPWPGLDPRPFDAPAPARTDTAGACALLARGCLVAALGLIALALPIPHPLTRAWVACAGLLCAFHLGGFDALAALYRWNGIPVERLFDDPWRSRSLVEFWGRRWNRAFHAVSLDHLYRPLARRLGRALAVLAVFLFSGLTHELVISFPAGGGWGLPTLYFALHGALVALEKRGTIRASRALTLAAVLLPLPILFHPPFLMNCVLPLVTP